MAILRQTSTGSTGRDASLGRSFWQIWNRFGILLILLVFALALTLLTDRFLTGTNLLNLARQSAVLGLISLGLLVVILTGNVDLTVGTFSGFAGALMAQWAINLGLLPAIVLGLGVALLVGFINGFLSTRGVGLSVIVTLAMLTIFQGATLLFTEGRPIRGIPDSMRELGWGYVGPIPLPIVITVAAAILVHILLRHTTFGRQLYAIGGNSEAARLSGIAVRVRIIQAYMISASFAMIAGLVLTARTMSAQPTAGVGDEFSAVGAVLIGGASLNGGAGNVVGTLAGVLILGMISNGLNLLQVNPFYQYIIKGLVILFAILMDQWGRRQRA
ncbi:MAG: ABC transporter permease [Anaerolineae bacterium]|nr:ABC transporter permease [Anaerolineae bacterium]